jgi:tRNA pseudouridine55 synthase
VSEDVKAETPAAGARPQQFRRPPRFEVNGWINLDKPVGVTSTQAVARLKRLFNAKKVGHAGTLDPLASGVLPVALGEATKTVPIVQDGAKAYEFVVRWGVETDTDDAEGKTVAASDARPSPDEIESALPSFVGVISQTPPTFSAIRIAGERAYDLARGGETFEIAPRLVAIHRFALVAAERDEARFEADCGKGAYVRALARDLGRKLGCRGHVVLLRRLRVGPFHAAAAIGLETAEASAEARASALQPVEAGLAELPRVAIDRNGAATLRRGQKLLLRGAVLPESGAAYACCLGAPIAFGAIEDGYFVSTRVFNLPA